LITSGTTCRTTGADCYAANTCTGTDGACPSTLKSPSSTCNDEGNPSAAPRHSVSGPGGDTVGTNNTTQLVIDMLDKNDF